MFLGNILKDGSVDICNWYNQIELPTKTHMPYSLFLRPLFDIGI